MNTIPLTFNENQINTTIIGGKEISSEKIPISIILLNKSGTTFRMNNLESLIRLGFTDIVSIEAPGRNFTLDELAKKYSYVKFIIPGEQLSTGEMINLGMQEVRHNKVLVLWDTMHISTKVITDRLLATLLKEDILCFVPFLFTEQMQNLPVKNIPSIDDGSFNVKSFSVAQYYSKNLYPFDFFLLLKIQSMVSIRKF